MKSIGESFGIAACGLVTSVLTALGVVTLSNIIGFNLYTVNLLIIVPVGAIFTGFAAASGYYFGSLFFQKRATGVLLLQMVVIAGVSQFLIYYMQYNTLLLPDGRRVSDLLLFGQYLDIALTSAHYRIGRAMTDTGEVGSFGYLLAGLQFLGFLFGGLAVWGWLGDKAYCEKCSLYLRRLGKREQSFISTDAASPHYDHLFDHPVDGDAFAALIRAESSASETAGAIRIKTALLGCSRCKAQVIQQGVQVHNDREWKDARKLDRRIRLPEGVDLRGVFSN